MEMEKKSSGREHDANNCLQCRKKSCLLFCAISQRSSLVLHVTLQFRPRWWRLGAIPSLSLYLRLLLLFFYQFFFRWTRWRGWGVAERGAGRVLMVLRCSKLIFSFFFWMGNIGSVSVGIRFQLLMISGCMALGQKSMGSAMWSLGRFFGEISVF